MKVKIHFNRVNMQRGNPRVWTAHTSHACNQARRIRVVHEGKVVLETAFDPQGRQPRAYLVANGTVTRRGGTVTVAV